MTIINTFAQRVGYVWTRVALATILSDEKVSLDGEQPISLHDEVSCDGLCYVQVVGQAAGGDLYMARVASAPDLVSVQPFTVYFTEEQLRFALPWDCRLEGKSTLHILALLRAHAAALRPASQHLTPATPFVETPVAPSAEVLAVQEDEGLTPLPPVYVSERRMRKVLSAANHQALTMNIHRRHVGLWGRLHSWLTVAFLQAALKATARWHMMQQALSRALDALRHTRQAMVSVSEVHEDGRRVGWWVIIGAPQLVAA